MFACRRAVQWSCYVAVLIVLQPRCAAQRQRDLQLWPELHVSAKISDHFAATTYLSIRFADNIMRIFEQQYGAGLAYKPNRYVTLSPWYRYIRSQPTTTRTTHENRVAADLFMQTPSFHKLAMSDRNRGELRFIDGHTSERYRNRVQLEREVRAGQYKFTPYVSWETFYDTRFHAWYQKRYFIGARVPVKPRLWFEPYFMHRDDSQSRPHGTNVIYVAMNVSVR
jgi:hypothetical protein